MTYARKILLGTVLLLGSSLPAAANCFVDYKAKGTGGGLSLHYGVMALDAANCADSNSREAAVKRRLENTGWKLLRIVSSFGEAELGSKQEDAGEYYLRF